MFNTWCKYVNILQTHIFDKNNLVKIEIKKSNIQQIKETSNHHFKIEQSQVKSINLSSFKESYNNTGSDLESLSGSQPVSEIVNFLSMFFIENVTLFNSASLVEIINNSHVTNIINELNDIIIHNSKVDNLSGVNCVINVNAASIDNLNLSDNAKIISDEDQQSSILTAKLTDISSQLANLKIDNTITNHSTLKLTNKSELTTAYIRKCIKSYYQY